MITLTHKTCNKCYKELPISMFSKHSGSKAPNYYRPECKSCNNQLSKVRRYLKEQYGSPPKNYRCPICNGTEQDVKGKGGLTCSSWVIDHDHKTDKFRGWLCHKCNRGIGCFHDDITMLKKAIYYLECEFK